MEREKGLFKEGPISKSMVHVAWRCVMQVLSRNSEGGMSEVGSRTLDNN